MPGIRGMLNITIPTLEEVLMMLAVAAVYFFILFILSSIDRYFQDQEPAPGRVDIAFEKVWVSDGKTTDEIDTVGHYSYRAITTSFTLPW